MHKAKYYKSLENKSVQCTLCPHNCLIPNTKSGKCNVRINKDGELYSLTYNKPLSGSIDPIEKKPLYHFHPGEKIYSIGTLGCNLKCLHCQNWETSQIDPRKFDLEETTPNQTISKVMRTDSSMIAYTYNEPTIFYEYMYDCAKLARENGIKNVMVSNGFINKEPLTDLCQYLDAANIDLKSFNNKFYKEICFAKLEPVLETLKILKANNIWLEITNLIIPEHNDNLEEINKMCQWIAQNIGIDTPIHFSAFYPTYKLTNVPPTNIEILEKAYEIAKKNNIKYVYLGNVTSEKCDRTVCPKCKETIILRNRYEVITNLITNNKCICGEPVPGHFK